MLQLTRYKQIHIQLAGCAIAASILTGSLYAVYSSWNIHQRDIESSKMTLSQITNELSTAQRERTQLLAQLESYQTIDNLFDGYQRPESINELAVLAVALTEEAGLELEQFQPQEPRVINDQSVYPITVRITADYSKLSAWLDQIHERMPDIHIMSISIRSLNAQSTTITTDIRINWYSPNQS